MPTDTSVAKIDVYDEGASKEWTRDSAVFKEHSSEARK